MRKVVVLSLLFAVAMVASEFVIAPEVGYAQAPEAVRNGVIVSDGLSDSAVGTQLEDVVRPTSDVYIDFDDMVRPCLFSHAVALRNEYAGLGVRFSAPGSKNGGAVLDECGSFHVHCYTRPNFLAFNCHAVLSDTGVPQGPETLMFSRPVRRVFAAVGTGPVDSGAVLRVVAMNSSGTVLDSDLAILSPCLQLVEVASGEGISTVIIGTSAPCLWVLDDLGFDFLQAFALEIDILPQVCPNFISPPLRDIDYVRLRPMSAGATRPLPALPVAVLGGAGFDVRCLDSGSVRLEGLAPLRCEYRDVARPLVSRESGKCECTDRGPDGCDDMVFYFDRMRLMEMLAPWNDGETRTLALTARTCTMTPATGEDCVLYRRFGVHRLAEAEAGGTGATALGANAPNPFNAGTTITYSLAEDGAARLEVFDVLGRKVATLVDRFESAGPHQTEWSGRDDHGQSVASGMYFYRLTTTTTSETRKMVLLK